MGRKINCNLIEFELSFTNIINVLLAAYFGFENHLLVQSF